MAKTLEVPLDLDAAEALLKAQSVIDRLHSVGDTGASAGRKASGGMSELTGILDGVATKFMSIKLAIDLAKQAYDLFEQAQGRQHGQQTRNAQSLLQAMSMAGDLPRQDAVRSLIRGGGAFGVGSEQAAEIYKTVNRTWVGATWEQRAPVITGAMASAQAGKDPVKFAEIMAGLADLGMPVESLQGYANQLIVETGGNITGSDLDTLKVWVQAGGSLDEGMRMLVRGAKAGQGSRPFVALTEALGKQYTRQEMMQIRDPELRRFAGMNFSQRLTAARASQSLQTSIGLSQRQQAVFQEMAGEMPAGGRPLGPDVAAASGTPEGQEVLRRLRNEASAQSSIDTRGPMSWEDYKAAQDAMLDREGAGGLRRLYASLGRIGPNVLNFLGINPIKDQAAMRARVDAPTATVQIGTYYGSTPTENANNGFTRTGDANSR